MEMEGDPHDHINKFNQLVSQLLNVDNKFSNEEQALLLLDSLLRSFKVSAQMLLVGRLMQSYPARALDRKLQVDWAKDAREGPRVLMSLRVDFRPMG